MRGRGQLWAAVGGVAGAGGGGGGHVGARVGCSVAGMRYGEGVPARVCGGASEQPQSTDEPTFGFCQPSPWTGCR